MASSGGVFVGRDAELAVLTAALERADAGSPGVVLLGGDAGSGKTTVLNRATQEAVRRGFAVHLGTCVGLGDVGSSYLPVIDALRSIDAGAGADLVAAELAHGSALAHLLPHRTDADGGRAEADAEPGRVFEAVLRLLLALAENGPVALVLEDLHWADGSTRDLLAFLARTLRTGRVLVLGSYRTDDLHRRHPLRPLLAELVRLPSVERVALPPLTAAETVDLLDGLAGSPVDGWVADRIHERSGGNAFFAQELWRVLGPDAAAGLPGDLADVLLTQVDRLPPDGRQVVDALAVAARLTSTEVLAGVIGVGADGLDRALRIALDAGVIVAAGAEFGFRHALMQEAVYRDLMPGARVRWHRAFAERLDEPAEVAHHLLAAHDLPAALAALVVAAGRAEELVAPIEALQFLTQAVELLEQLGTGADRLDLLERATVAASGAGDPDRAIDFAVLAVHEADAVGVLPARARTRERLARMQMDADRDSATAAGEAVALLEQGPPSAELAQALATLARRSVWIDPDRTEHLLSRAADVAGRVAAVAIQADVATTRALLRRRGIGTGGDGSADAAGALLRESVALTRGRADALPARIRALRFLSTHLLESGDMAGALAAADEGVALAADAGATFTPYGQDLHLMRGWVLESLGRWDEMLAAARPAVHAPTAAGRVLGVQAVLVLAMRGDAEAETLLTRMRGTPDPLMTVQLNLAEIRLRLLQRRPAQAQALALAALPGDYLLGWGTEVMLLSILGLTALADRVAAGEFAADAAEVREPADRLRDRADRVRAQPSLRGPYGDLLRARLAVEDLRIGGRDRPEDWQAVQALAVATGRQFEQANAAAQEARTRLAAGDRGAGTVGAIRTARALGRALQAEPLLAQVDDLVRRGRLESALRTGRVDGPVSSPLTGREGEVLAELASGRSNREISGRLFISEKTVSVHVSNILAKLSAASRTRAVAIARERGLLG